jgi:hypothetical protein
MYFRFQFCTQQKKSQKSLKIIIDRKHILHHCPIKGERRKKTGGEILTGKREMRQREG